MKRLLLVISVLMAFAAIAAAQGTKKPLRFDTPFMLCDSNTGNDYIMAHGGLKRDYPRHITSVIEFRDRADVMWPSFAWGNPTGLGLVTYSATAPIGSYKLKMQKIVQDSGDQSRRVLGKCFVDGKAPEVSFELKSFSKQITEDVKFVDAKGVTGTRKETYIPCKGIMTVGEKVIDMQGRATLTYPGPNTDPLVQGSLYITLRFSITADKLGYAVTDEIKDIDIRVAASAYPAPLPQPTGPDEM